MNIADVNKLYCDEIINEQVWCFALIYCMRKTVTYSEAGPIYG